MINIATGGAQTNSARSPIGGDARQQAPTGLGGLGLPNLESMLGGMGGMPDATALTQLMQNPAISQMMQSILSNPQTMNQVTYNKLHLLNCFLSLTCNVSNMQCSTRSLV